MSAISDKVKAAKDLAEVSFHVDEWDVDLLLISPTVDERLAMIEEYSSYNEDVDGEPVQVIDRGAMSPALVIACAHDPETRERAFVADDMGWLRAKNGAVVEAVAMKCFPLVGFGAVKGDGATDPGKDDSSTTPSTDSLSSLPASSDAP